MPISLQADSSLPRGHILVDGQRVASFSTTGGLSATLDQNTITTLSIQNNAITTEKIDNNAVTTEKINNNAITAEKLDSIGQGAGNPPVYACRAWVNFNGSTTPPTINSSGNVSSITRTDPGRFTINFATAMPSINYSICSSTGATDSNPSARTIVVNRSVLPTINNCSVITGFFTTSQTYENHTPISVSIFC